MKKYLYKKNNKKKVYTDFQIFNAVTACNGNIRQARLMLKMSIHIYKRIKDSPLLREQIDNYLAEKAEETIEQAETLKQVLFEQAKMGDTKAIKLFMDKYDKFFNINNLSGINNIIEGKQPQITQTEVVVGFKTITAEEENTDNECPDGSPLYELDEN